MSGLDRLETSYRPYHDPPSDSDSDEAPLIHNTVSPVLRANVSPLSNRGDPEAGPPGAVFVAEGGKSSSGWSHIDDLDSFFKKVYRYHQKHGFTVMMMEELLNLLQFLFIVLFTVFWFECVDYNVLFDKENYQSLKDGHHKATIANCIIPPSQWLASFSTTTWACLLVATAFWVTKALATFYNFFQYWDIKSFYNVALKIKDCELESLSWHEVQQKLLQAQEEHLMCIHKSQLTELDIYHRILRYKNYLVAMVNKDLLPVRFNVPFAGEKIFLSRGLKFNFQFVLFKGPWAPFNQWHLKEDYKKVSKKKELVENLKSKIALLALINFLLMPLILLWQVLYSFFNYAALIKKEPGSLGVRKWSQYGRLYLRHFNELDHEFRGRLNRAYKPANKYMDLFVSPMSVVIAQFLTFLAGAPLAVLLALSVWDEDVLAVEHIITLITALGGVVAVCRLFVPDENMVFCPEKTLTAVLAHIHYFPDAWKGEAHTYKVMAELGELFPYTAVYLFCELISPIVTPFILYFSLRPKSAALIDFFRNFTVDVVGVGDVCSFAQLDVRKHGNPQWQREEQETPATNNYTQAEDGKTEMSLVHFALTNPKWRPPMESQTFLTHLRDQATKDAEALGTVQEEMDNALFNSLSSLDSAGGVYSSLANNVLQEVNMHNSNNASQILQSMQQTRGAEGGAGFASSQYPHAPSLYSSRLFGATSTLSPPPNLSCATSTLAPPPNLRQDLKGIGLEYTEADMSLSALYMHELHYRRAGGGSRRGLEGSRRNLEASRYEFNQRRASLNELDEENLPLVETSEQQRLASSMLA